jgi:hypothetical protein
LLRGEFLGKSGHFEEICKQNVDVRIQSCSERGSHFNVERASVYRHSCSQADKLDTDGLEKGVES